MSTRLVERAAPINPPEVQALIARAVRGEESALHSLGMRVMPRVRNAVRYLVRGDEIDDIVQDVLVTVFERLASYSGEGRFEAWVDGVALRVTLGRMRKLRALQRRTEPLAVDAISEPGAGLGPRYATSRQLVRALDHLADHQRMPLVMHHVFGWTVPEIAAELAAPLETVRTRMRDGMIKLRMQLEVYVGDDRREERR